MMYSAIPIPTTYRQVPDYHSRHVTTIILTLLNVGLSAVILINHLFYRNHAAYDTNTYRNQTAYDTLPWIHVITPTSNTRLEQKADLTRLSQTLSHVRRLHWILVEDANNKTDRIRTLLDRSGVDRFTHLATRTTGELYGRGMEQRNLALEHLRSHEKNSTGIVYFADDDNAYDIRVFDECMRHVSTVGVWPVGMVGGSMVEEPMVNADGQNVIGWNVNFIEWRKFATDMAGFAINLSLIHRYPNASFNSGCQRNLYETCFLEQMEVELDDLQPICSKTSRQSRKSDILVWHTKTKSSGRVGGNKGYDV